MYILIIWYSKSMSTTATVNNLPDWKITLKYRNQLPFCKSLWIKYLKQQIKTLQSEINSFPDIERKINNIIARAPRKDQWFFELVADVFYRDDLPKLQRQLKSLTFKLAALENEENISQGYSEAQIEQAKSVPLEKIFPNPLRKVGGRLVGRCVFHQDKLPSFTIYPQQNSFYCYSCNQGGDIIKFVELKEQCSFREAIKYLLST